MSGTHLQHGFTISQRRGLAKVIKSLDFVSLCAQALCITYSKVEERVTAASIGCLLKPFDGLGMILLDTLASQITHTCEMEINKGSMEEEWLFRAATRPKLNLGNTCKAEMFFLPRPNCANPPSKPEEDVILPSVSIIRGLGAELILMTGGSATPCIDSMGAAIVASPRPKFGSASVARAR